MEKKKRKTNTKENLYAAMIELLKTKPLQEITIQDLCSEAAINRSTFYLHYLNQMELYNEIEESFLLQAKDYMINCFNNINNIEMIQQLLDHYKNSNAVVILFNQKENSSFENKLKEQSFQLLKELTKKMWHEIDIDYICHFIIDGSCAIIKEWTNRRFVDDSSYVANLMYKTMTSIDLYHH